MTSLTYIRIFYLIVALGIALTVWITFFDPTLDIVESESTAGNDLYVRTFTTEFTKNCAGDKECIAYVLYRYVKDNEEPVEGRAALLDAYFRSADIFSAVIPSESGEYTLGCGLDVEKLRAYILDSGKLMEDTAYIAAGQLWVAIPNIHEEQADYEINISADLPVQLYVFPSGQEINFDRELYFRECTAIGQNIQQQCSMYNGNAVVVYAPNGNTRITLRVMQHMGEISTSLYKNQNCVQFLREM